MFYVITIVAVLAVGGVIAFRHGVLKASAAEASLPARRFERVDSLAGMATWVGFGVLVVTGFLTGHLTGYFLLLHVFGGAVFAVGLTAVVILRAEANSGPCCREGGNLSIDVEKVFFWALALSGLCLILTAVLAMVPLLGTYGQICIAVVHKYVAIPALVSGLGYGYIALLRRAAAAGIAE